MREIKFRALMKNKNQWVYGDLINKCHDFNNHHSIFQFNGGCVKVKQNTIGQYTGFKDRNGKEIYEGDILNSLYRNDGCKGVYVVAFDYGGFYPRKHKKHQQNEVLIKMYDLQRCEVIGNIYENPELLEVI